MFTLNSILSKVPRYSMLLRREYVLSSDGEKNRYALIIKKNWVVDHRKKVMVFEAIVILGVIY